MKKLVACVSFAALTMAGTLAFAQGVDTYKAKCAMCHGADGKGQMAKKMGSHDLTDPAVQGKSEADIVGIVTNGQGKMTGFKGKLADDQIKAVAAYVKTLK
jgi:mono/diheme cytochrome c family protein